MLLFSIEFFFAIAAFEGSSILISSVGKGSGIPNRPESPARSQGDAPLPSLGMDGSEIVGTSTCGESG